jgi:hypothetical protein
VVTPLLAKAAGGRHYDLVNEQVALELLAQIDQPGPAIL